MPVRRVPQRSRAVRLCHEHARLASRSQAGLPLFPEERARLQRLDAAVGLPTTDEQRRHHRRVPLFAPARIQSRGRLLEARVLNISSGGMFVAGSRPLAAGERVIVRVARPAGPPLAFDCVVVRAGDYRGVEGHGLAIIAAPAAGAPLPAAGAGADMTGADAPMAEAGAGTAGADAGDPPAPAARAAAAD